MHSCSLRQTCLSAIWPEWLFKSVHLVLGPARDTLNALHSGLIGDYVAWIVAGIAMMASMFAFTGWR